MKTYTGTKTVQATPMTRAAYNDYRGWDLPGNEDGTDEGYLLREKLAANSDVPPVRLDAAH